MTGVGIELSQTLVWTANKVEKTKTDQAPKTMRLYTGYTGFIPGQHDPVTELFYRYS